MDTDLKKQVFVSYSTKDTGPAEAIRAALEAAGVGCWIAPRDLSAGSQWGGGIVQAIEQCVAVLVVFSAASNDSPQVAREMEIAVSNRRPLIPVRVEDVMPTQDMQFFLGVSHWFNAYPKPIETYLPDIVAATQRVLAGEARSWNSFTKRLPKNRWAQAGLAAAVASVALLGGKAMIAPSNPMAQFKIPLAGRWTTPIKTDGGKVDCVLDVQDMGQARYSEDCPAPVQSASGSLAWTKDATWAQDQFRQGDTGSFLFQGGSAHGYAAAFRVGWGGLTTRDGRLGELKWRKISAAKPMTSAADDIVPKSAAWPLQGVPAMAQKAQAYARAHWKKDAVLMSVSAKLVEGSSGGVAGLQTPDGGVDLAFRFYSPEAQEGLQLSPGSGAGAMSSLGSADWNPGEALPSTFMDLADAVALAHENGMRGKQISEAELEWTGGEACGTGVFAIDNAILPKCRPGRFVGVQWTIRSALGERLYVRAAQ